LGDNGEVKQATFIKRKNGCGGLRLGTFSSISAQIFLVKSSVTTIFELPANQRARKCFFRKIIAEKVGIGIQQDA
jgi:hypothetical protein